MKTFKTTTQKKLAKLTCDACRLEASIDEGYAFQEFISIEHTCGYGSVHGDNQQLSLDLCQYCFSKMYVDNLTIFDPFKPQAAEQLEYDNIFQAITQSKNEATELKENSDIKISIRDIISNQIITNQEELQTALKRVKRLWDAKKDTKAGDELDILINIISDYEDSFVLEERNHQLETKMNVNNWK
jgi:hypothetical protein